MNIWAINKEPEIRKFLIIYEMQLGCNNLKIKEKDESSTFSIYLAHPIEPEIHAYVHILGQTPGHFGVHLEYYNHLTQNDVEEIYENLTLNSLIQILAVHFDIATITKLPDVSLMSSA